MFVNVWFRLKMLNERTIQMRFNVIIGAFTPKEIFSWIFLLLFGTKLFVVVVVVVKFPIVCVNAWFKLKTLNEKRNPK